MCRQCVCDRKTFDEEKRVVKRKERKKKIERERESTNTVSDPSNAAASKARATTPKRVAVDDVHATDFIVVSGKSLRSSKTDEKFDTCATIPGVISRAC